MYFVSVYLFTDSTPLAFIVDVSNYQVSRKGSRPLKLLKVMITKRDNLVFGEAVARPNNGN